MLMNFCHPTFVDIEMDTQHALLSLIDKWRKELENKGYAGDILMDLSKAFDAINHELLIANYMLMDSQKTL